jgi:hypothetical protein
MRPLPLLPLLAQHHDPHALNYAQAAREEVHEAATSPRAVALRGKSGVEAWDKVRRGSPLGGLIAFCSTVRQCIAKGAQGSSGSAITSAA